MRENELLGFYKQHRLPHLDKACLLQFVTFVLSDAAPKQQKPMATHKPEGDLEFLRMDAILDHGPGSCQLENTAQASMVLETIFSLEGSYHHPLAWVIMPNHVHLLTAQARGCSLRQLMQLIKGKSAYIINKDLNRSGKFWQKGYFDRAIRSMEHLGWTIEYIHENPVKARLVSSARDWQFSSIHTYNERSMLEEIERLGLSFLS